MKNNSINVFLLSLFSLFLFAGIMSYSEAENTFILVTLPLQQNTSTVTVSPLENTNLTLKVDGVDRPIVIDNSRSIKISAKQSLLLIDTPDEKPISATNITVSTEAGNLIGIRTGNTETTLYFPGKIVFSCRSQGNFEIIQSAGIENLIDYALALLYPGGRNQQEAIKAASIILRTYITYHWQNFAVQHLEIYDFPLQGFKPLDILTKMGEIRKLLHGTRRKVLTFNNNLTEGFYTISCGGFTALPDMATYPEPTYPYRQTNCPFCRKSEFYKWERAFDKKILATLFEMKGDRFSIEITPLPGKGGYVKSIMLSDGEKKLDLGANAFRRKINRSFRGSEIISNSFSVDIQKDQIIFRGRGRGKGLGFCIHGAKKMSAIGYNWQNIIDFYYPGTEITVLESKKDAHKQ